MYNKILVFFIFMISSPIVIAYHINYHQNSIDIFYVDDDNKFGPWDGSETYPFCNIQDAVDNASSGDVIIVKAGLYIENIFIDFPLSLIGQVREHTIIDGNGVKDCIYLTSNADGTVISGFTIQNSGNKSGGGIFDQGIDVHASGVLITNNIISHHANNGIWIWCSENNNISYNLIGDNHRAGIEVNDCKTTKIYRNYFSRNYEWAIMFHFDGISIDNYIIENTFIDNFKGMCLVRQADNYILRNNFFNNSGGHGRSDFTIFSKCSSFTNTWGANFWDDWNSSRPRHISGLFSFDIDRNPMKCPYEFNEGD